MKAPGHLSSDVHAGPSGPTPNLYTTISNPTITLGLPTGCKIRDGQVGPFPPPSPHKPNTPPSLHLPPPKHFLSNSFPTISTTTSLVLTTLKFFPGQQYCYWLLSTYYVQRLTQFCCKNWVYCEV